MMILTVHDYIDSSWIIFDPLGKSSNKYLIIDIIENVNEDALNYIN